MIRRTALAAAIALLPFSQASAVDSVSFESGRGNEGTELWRVGLQFGWERKWLAERSWNVVAYWDVQFGRWTGNREPLGDLGVTPVFRLQRAAEAAVRPYFEGAIGFHVLSDLQVSSRRIFSTKFQYGDHLAAGVRYGERHRYDVSVRLQHLSNGGIAHPNPGINFWQMRLGYHFE